jgi:hypothetical protein
MSVLRLVETMEVEIFPSNTRTRQPGSVNIAIRDDRVRVGVSAIYKKIHYVSIIVAYGRSHIICSD